MQGKVEFCGSVAGGDAVLEWLDDIDIYLQPSFHEGLPRALIEAMSRGCYALASDAGGTDELLSSEYIHMRGDSAALANHIRVALTADIDSAKECARRNFFKARNYSREILEPRRENFWKEFVRIVKERQNKA